LADDDVLSNTALRAIIEAGGNYQVTPFFNGLELCKFYEEQGDDIAAILLDLEMPERNGIETAKWIRNYELNERRRRVPIIVTTGHESEEIKSMCIKAGVNQILTKPINKKEVLKVLKDLT